MASKSTKKKTKVGEDNQIAAVVELNTGDTGSIDARKNRERALKRLEDAKVQELEKLKNGYKWMIKGKIYILANPKRIDEFLKDGFRLIIKK